jgi:hypothetical protein
LLREFRRIPMNAFGYIGADGIWTEYPTNRVYLSSQFERKLKEFADRGGAAGLGAGWPRSEMGRCSTSSHWSWSARRWCEAFCPFINPSALTGRTDDCGIDGYHSS